MPPNASNLEKAIHDRDCVKTTIEYLQSEVQSHSTTPLTEPEVDHLLSMVKETQNNVMEIHKRIQHCAPPEMAPHQQEYHKLLSWTLKLLSAFTGMKMTFPIANSSASLRVGSINTTTSEIRLPKLELPTFDGDLHEWVSFRDMFMNAVHDNPVLSKSQKLTYLKTQLRGEAARQIQSMIISDANYDIAWSQLTARYQNDRELLFAILRRFVGQPFIQEGSAAAVRQLVDISRECIRSLDVLKLPTDSWDAILMFHIFQKLDTTSKQLWEQSLKDSSIPTLKCIFEFLEQRARALAAGGSTTKSTTKATHHKIDSDKQRNHGTRNIAYHSQSSTPCKICTKAVHPIWKCPTFIAMAPQGRIEAVKEQHLCYNCLQHGHSVSQCQNTKNCKVCDRRHHTLLHKERPVQTPTDVKHDTSIQTHHVQDSTEKTAVITAAAQANSSETLLATASIMVLDRNGNPQSCRAFLDNGSNRSYITDSCARRLGLHRKKCLASIAGLNEHSLGTVRHSTLISMAPHHKTSPILHVETLIIPHVTGKLPLHPFDHSKWPHLQGLQLADPHYHIPAFVDILLGAEVFFAILKDGRISGPSSGPTAVNSTLGWLIGGGSGSNEDNMCTPPSYHAMVHKLPTIPMNLDNSSVQTLYDKTLTESLSKEFCGNVIQLPHQTETAACHADEPLDLLLRQFWEIESTPSINNLTKEEQLCELKFKTTYKRDESGRFIVKLPFKDPQPALGESLDIAIRRFMLIEKRLQRHPNLKQDYVNFMKEYITLGHMVEVKDDEVQQFTMCYIPHHFVVKESSLTTKFRVVFDASAQTTNGISLNDILMVGPTIQDNLTDILMRFRLHKIAFTADIAKMYRQILVAPEDSNMQRIVWREDPSQPLKHFQLLTVTYGTASAPFLATRSLQELADLEGKTFPVAAEKLKGDFYVDDLLSGAPNEEQALKVQSQLIQLCAKGGFTLRSWTSNSNCLIEALPSELRKSQPLQSLDLSPTVKTLGLFWNPITDQFEFQLSSSACESLNSAPTKRMILSQIAKVFDPLGWLAPVMITAKILMQDLWKLKIGWDETLPDATLRKWSDFVSDLQVLQSFRIQRHYSHEWPEADIASQCLPKSVKRCLVGFADASEKAYAAIVYLCVYDSINPPIISLICSKTRVAPTKQITLPKLELCAALLLAELMTSVQGALKIAFHSITAWTDSTIVLSWISSHPSRWKTFVANRVGKIQEHIQPEAWGHVDGKSNPADCASRGIGATNFLNHQLWWHGPSWLSEGIPAPQSTIPSTTNIHDEERHAYAHVSMALTSGQALLCKFSSLKKLKRVTAYILRFLHNILARINLRKSTEPTNSIQIGALTPTEIDEALLIWVRIVQRQEYSKEIDSLMKNHTLPPNSKILCLTPFLDEHKVLRVGGRLKNSQLSLDQRNPILLPRHGRLTELIISNEHINSCHAGPQLLLSTIQRRFWIIRARDAIRQQIRKCVTCARQRAETIQQCMADLPAFRVVPKRAFASSGVDYAGPFLIRPLQPRSKTTLKAYLAIFVCCTTRAIHLEVVSDLSTNAFLAALRRFISRRGKPDNIYSDCGSNFIGADREMKKMIAFVNSTAYNQTMANNMANDGIQWHFNPPAAPHFGGLWEAGVKSVKYHLRRIMGNIRLTFEEITTVICQIEACLNSRPLTPESSDTSDLAALTPGHFLIGSPLTALPEPNLQDIKVNRLNRWQLVQQLFQHFWHRWTNEYVTRLQQRPKWMTGSRSIKVGDMVIIKDDRHPPLQWQLGRVLQLHPGSDATIRVVSLKTTKGVIKRPVVKICLLPIEDNLDNPEESTSLKDTNISSAPVEI